MVAANRQEQRALEVAAARRQGRHEWKIYTRATQEPAWSYTPAHGRPRFPVFPSWPGALIAVCSRGAGAGPPRAYLKLLEGAGNPLGYLADLVAIIALAVLPFNILFGRRGGLGHRPTSRGKSLADHADRPALSPCRRWWRV